MNLQPGDRKEFVKWYKTLNIEYFSAQEVLIHTDKPPNHVPPREIWGNIIPTLIVLDMLRDTLRTPIVLSSVYRSPAYNASVGGSRISQHMAFTACDFSVAGYSPDFVGDLLRTSRSMEFKLEKIARIEVPPSPWKAISTETGFIFKGGIGIYQRFCHLDTRGINVGWRGKY